MSFPVVTVVYGFNYFEMISSNIVLLSVKKKPLGLIISHFVCLLLKSCLGMNIVLLNFSRLAFPDKTGHIFFPCNDGLHNFKQDSYWLMQQLHFTFATKKVSFMTVMQVFFFLNIYFIYVLGKSHQRQHVQQKSREGQDCQEAPSARDLQCLCYVRPVTDSGVQGSLQHDWSEPWRLCGQGRSAWHAGLTG